MQTKILFIPASTPSEVTVFWIWVNRIDQTSGLGSSPAVSPGNEKVSRNPSKFISTFPVNTKTHITSQW